jgi:hypothetical protein
MMGFTGEELLLSVLHALIYGAIFSAVYQMMRIAFDMILALPTACKDMLIYKNIFSVTDFNRYTSVDKRGWFFSFFSLIAYFLGFLLLSYYSLDGQVRIYMLLISSATFYAFNLSFCVVFRRIVLFLLGQILAIVTVALRIVLLPIKIFVRKFYKKDLNI